MEERSKPAPAKAEEAIPSRDCHALINQSSTLDYILTTIHYSLTTNLVG